MLLLETRNLGIAFGGLQALEGLNLSLKSGEIMGLIGPNGAGKTTVFNLLTQVYQPTEGEILLEGKSIKGQKTYQIAQQMCIRDRFKTCSIKSRRSFFNESPQ